MGDSGRGRWLTVKLETSSRGNRSIEFSFYSFLLFPNHFRFATTTTTSSSSSSPFGRREISFKKSRTICHHRLGVEPTTLGRDPFILILAGDKNKREEAALHTIDDDKFLTSNSRKPRRAKFALLLPTDIYLVDYIVTRNPADVYCCQCHLSAVLFHVCHCVSPVSPNGSLLCISFRTSWKFLFFLPSRVFLLSASSTTTGLYKGETKKKGGKSRPFLPSMNNQKQRRERERERRKQIGCVKSGAKVQ